MEYLSCHDFRTLEKWCQKNGIKIYSSGNGRHRYIMRKAFEYEYLKNFIADLQFEYGEKWVDAYEYYTSLNAPPFLKILKPNEPSYKPKGNHEKHFLTRLTNYSNAI